MALTLVAGSLPVGVGANKIVYTNDGETVSKTTRLFTIEVPVNRFHYANTMVPLE